MADSRGRFTDTAEVYATHRPSPPDAVFGWIEAEAGLSSSSRIVDVGCGTGIATRAWAERGYAVVGVEPNDAMLRLAREAGGAEYVRGDADALGLPAAAAHLVVASQAFHYFDVDATLAEWKRVLVPGGACAVFWYRVSASTIREALHALFLRFGEPREPYRTKKKSIRSTLARRPGLTNVAACTFRHEQVLFRDGWRGRVLASSRMSHASSKPGFDEAVARAFDEHAEAGRIAIPLETTVVAWRFA